MTLTELKYIVTLAQERHFGHAAEKCFVSQPTLSVAVKKLEEELGVALFERSKSAVQLTPIGERIVAQAHRVLEQAATIKELAQLGKDQLSTPLRIGAIYTIGPYLFPQLVSGLRALAPQMPLYIEENYTAVLRQRLRSTELDAILVALPFTEPDVLTRPLYEEPFELLLPKNHPWAEREAIPIQELTSQKLLMLGEGHCFRDQVLEACPGLEANLKNSDQTLVAEGGSLETLRHMVASGMGITVLPHSAVAHHQYNHEVLVTRPFADPAPSRQVALAWRASFPRPKAIEALAQAIHQFKPL
ncbi:hydrogen peroxide-inducible genes activator [Marinospirillum sp. MEB164]|uniref:Hydrogen peroxide-inducible genes activator n=1 Tax=Marinospirillum alkalitolerans TaxID=3123374 RepID=A0ABW8PVZ1_9GAMM